MSDYTPSIDRLRNAYVDRIDFEAQIIGVERPSDEQSFAEFDRTIAQIKAGALREAADWLVGMTAGYTHETPAIRTGLDIIAQLRGRADQLTK